MLLSLLSICFLFSKEASVATLPLPLKKLLFIYCCDCTHFSLVVASGGYSLVPTPGLLVVASLVAKYRLRAHRLQELCAWAQ